MTDYTETILENIRRNVSRNLEAESDRTTIEVKHLDWTEVANGTQKINVCQKKKKKNNKITKFVFLYFLFLLFLFLFFSW